MVLDGGLNVFHHSFIGFSSVTPVSNRREWKTGNSTRERFPISFLGRDHHLKVLHVFHWAIKKDNKKMRVAESE